MVYSRREKAISEFVHVQESSLASLLGVTISNPTNSDNSNEFVYENSEVQLDKNLDLPIAIRKGTKTCT